MTLPYLFGEDSQTSDSVVENQPIGDTDAPCKCHQATQFLALVKAMHRWSHELQELLHTFSCPHVLETELLVCTMYMCTMTTDFVVNM